jgi:sugar phosphate permease
MLLFFSTTNSLFQTGSSDAMRGRVMGVWALVFGGMTPIGGLEAGAVSHYAGVRCAVAVGGCVCGVAALAVWWIARHRPERLDQAG